ncbi:hypothetical protein NHP200010_15340 [Helicobacter bizzozeronii]|uniref:hypothetical protein n=1 Tax=Helicobacter bizzozeronii TaxID=56877 RepID=UPI00244D918D|nr:hypothetical protein [Helicobacter bizzozeronii]GMB93801.1 hypothetical protein NHP200010_15340 [Helicobacter bizzozeronii]
MIAPSVLPALLLSVVLSLCMAVFARKYAWLKALGVLGICHIPVWHTMSLSALLVGLFSTPSPLSLVLCLWALIAKYKGLECFPFRVALFLSLFGAFVFLDMLELLPFSLTHASPIWVIISLCLWSVLAFLVHRPLGVLFLLTLFLATLNQLNKGDSFVLLYVGFMDIYLWAVALIWVLKGMSKTLIKNLKHP